MFDDAHDLEGVVAGCDDAGEGVFAEFGVGSDFGFFLGHADVGFIDDGVLDAFFGVGLLPLVGLGGVPDLGGEDVGLGVLDGAACVGGDALGVAAGPEDVEFV